MIEGIRFKDFEDVLADAGSLADAAEAHGSLCGALCCMSPYRMQDWLNEILPDGASLSDERAAMIERVFTATAASFGERAIFPTSRGSTARLAKSSGISPKSRAPRATTPRRMKRTNRPILNSWNS